MGNRPDKAIRVAHFHALIADGENGMRIWATAPPTLFASDPDRRRWDARFAGKPLAETEGAFRVRLIETPRGKRRWHVEIAVGGQRFSLSSHDHREAAERDARLFGSLFDPDAVRLTPEERGQLEEMRGPGESFSDVILRLAADQTRSA
jgi:hypothetical protein